MASEDLLQRALRLGDDLKPQGFSCPEDVDARAGTSGYDATQAINQARQQGNVWLSSGVHVNERREPPPPPVPELEDTNVNERADELPELL